MNLIHKVPNIMYNKIKNHCDYDIDSLFCFWFFNIFMLLSLICFYCFKLCWLGIKFDNLFWFSFYYIITLSEKKSWHWVDIWFYKNNILFFYLQKLKNKGNKIQSEGKMEPCFNLKLIIQLLLSEKILEIFLNFHYGHLV